MEALARTTAEMSLAASLMPCPACGGYVVDAIEFEPEGDRWRGVVTCPGCGRQRSFVFAAKNDPSTAHRTRWNLGDGVSAILGPNDYLRALDAASARMPQATSRVMTCLIELIKLVPSDADRVPNTTDERLTKAWLDAEYKRLWLMVERGRPPSSVTPEAIAAHDAWLENGAKGPGQLVLEGKRLCDEKYDKPNWSLARIVDCDLTNVVLYDARLQLARLHGVTLTGARLWGARFPEASIEGGRWTFADLMEACLVEAVVDGTDFSGSTLDRVDFTRARVRGAKFDGVQFGNSVFDGAEFEACTFRHATLAELISPPTPTSRGARFVECDFTGVDWSKRDLSATTFVRCKLAGARGRAHYGDGLVFEGCDVDLGSFPATRRTNGPSRATIEALASGPPRTVGELLAILDARVDDDAVRAMRGNSFELPGVSGKYEESAEKPSTAEALAARRLAFWKLDFADGLPMIEEVLAQRFGAPIATHDSRRYGAFIVSTGSLAYEGFAFAGDVPLALGAIAVSPDGATIALGDAAGRVRVWSPSKERVTGYFLLGFPVLRIAWTSDGERLVAITDLGRGIEVFSSDGAKHEKTIPTRPVADLAMHPSKPLFATTGSAGGIQVWDPARGSSTLDRPGSPGHTIAMSEAHVAVGYQTGHLKVWELATGKSVHESEIFDTAIDGMAFRHDGQRLALGAREGGVVTITPGSWARTPQESTPPASSIAYAPPPGIRRFVCTHRNGSCTLFSGDYGNVVGDLVFEKAKAAFAASFVPGTELLLVAHGDGRIRVWRMGATPTKIGELAFEDHVVPRVVEPVDAKDLAAWWGSALRAAQKTCAACRAVVAPERHAAGIGEDCPACGHVAPDVSVAYPGIAAATAVRAELLALRGRSRDALRCLAIANLFDTVDLRQEEEWSRRAAKLDRDAGAADGARAAELRADWCAAHRRIDEPRIARTAAEIRFFASLAPCAACGKTALDASWNLFGAKTKWQLIGRCPHCSASRALPFVTESDPNAATCPPGELGDARPSSVIEPSAFLTEALRLEPLAPTDAKLRDRAFVCIRELAKSPPEVLARLAKPDGKPVTPAWLQVLRMRMEDAWLGANGAPVELITRVLFDDAGPPPTVGALEQALGLRLTDANVPTNAHGVVQLDATPLTSLGPDVQRVTMEYPVRRPVKTLQDLRARPLTRWSIGLRRGYEVAQRELAGRAGFTVAPSAPEGACSIAYASVAP